MVISNIQATRISSHKKLLRTGKMLLYLCSLLFATFITFAGIQKPFVVIIPSYNNGAWCTKNIESVLNQNYENFRIIYIDDCSTDNTYQLVFEKIKTSRLADKVTLIHNASRRGALANIYTAVHCCQDDEIIALVDGDDWLAHERVLEVVNNAYQDANIWMTYGQFQVHPDGRIGECKDIPKGISRGNYYREYDWCTSHLRTFYAGLFKQIKLQDLIYRGNFFEVTWDMALLFPMLEMSGGRFVCIKDVLYIYNCATDANDFKTKLLLQIHCNKLISSKSKYEALSVLPVHDHRLCNVSILMVSKDNPAALRIFLESLSQYGSGFQEIRILFAACNDENLSKYAEIQKEFPYALYEKYTPNFFKSALLGQLQASKKYCVLARDGLELNEPVRFDHCAQALCQTHALGFYLGLGKNIVKHASLERLLRQPRFIALEQDLCAWHLSEGEYDWRTPFTFTMAMYRTDVIKPLCEQARYDSWQSLEAALSMASVDVQSVGLIYEKNKTRKMDNVVEHL